jgi:hypothetical protein
VLFNRVMDQFEAADKGDLQRLRVALTADNVKNVDIHMVTVGQRYTGLRTMEGSNASTSVSRWVPM